MTDDNRPFPIQGESERLPGHPMRYIKACAIPWWLAEVAYEGYWSSQSLERIAERGGFGRQELVSLIRSR